MSCKVCDGVEQFLDMDESRHPLWRCLNCGYGLDPVSETERTLLPLRQKLRRQITAQM